MLCKSYWDLYRIISFALFLLATKFKEKAHEVMSQITLVAADVSCLSHVSYQGGSGDPGLEAMNKDR